MSEKPSTKKEARPKWLKVTLMILKYVRIPALCVIVLAVGLWIGYVEVGDQPASEMLSISTWKHLFDLVFAN